MQFTIPEPLKIESDELHAELAKATKASGRVGKAAHAAAFGLDGEVWLSRWVSDDYRASGTRTEK